MAGPKFRIEITDKKQNVRQEVAVAWQATKGKNGPEIPGVYNLQLGNKGGKQPCKVYLVVEPEGGQKFKVDFDSHFISLLENRPKPVSDEGVDDPEDF